MKRTLCRTLFLSVLASCLSSVAVLEFFVDRPAAEPRKFVPPAEATPLATTIGGHRQIQLVQHARILADDLATEADVDNDADGQVVFDLAHESSQPEQDEVPQWDDFPAEPRTRTESATTGKPQSSQATSSKSRRSQKQSQPADRSSSNTSQRVGNSRRAGRSQPADETDRTEPAAIVAETAADFDNAKVAWYLPIEQMTPQQEARRHRIRQTLEFYYNRMLNTVDDSPWSMMHHMLAWGADAQIWVGGEGGKRVSCIGWLCANGLCENERLLYVRDGQLYARSGPGLQGHEGQFLAMLAQARVRANQPIRVGDQTYTVEHLIRQEQLSCRPKTELTFRLMGLIHYLGTEASWEASDGQHWDFPRLIRDEISQPINGVTCGGTHRLMAQSYAVRRRIQEGHALDGQWARADKYTSDYRDYAFSMQHRDGSLSTDFFRSRANTSDIDRRLKTTGHMLEWLVFSCPHDELQDPQMLLAVDYLTDLLARNRYYDWGKGPLGHAIRALSLYDERVFGGEPGKRDLRLAKNPPRIQPRNKSAQGNAPSGAKANSSGRRPFLFRRGS